MSCRSKADSFDRGEKKILLILLWLFPWERHTAFLNRFIKISNLYFCWNFFYINFILVLFLYYIIDHFRHPAAIAVRSSQTYKNPPSLSWKHDRKKNQSYIMTTTRPLYLFNSPKKKKIKLLFFYSPVYHTTKIYKCRIEYEKSVAYLFK